MYGKRCGKIPITKVKDPAEAVILAVENCINDRNFTTLELQIADPVECREVLVSRIIRNIRDINSIFRIGLPKDSGERPSRYRSFTIEIEMLKGFYPEKYNAKTGTKLSRIIDASVKFNRKRDKVYFKIDPKNTDILFTSAQISACLLFLRTPDIVDRINEIPGALTFNIFNSLTDLAVLKNDIHLLEILAVLRVIQGRSFVHNGPINLLWRLADIKNMIDNKIERATQVRS
jgi:hypothetical protein